jgi:hypothetical protein
VVTKDEALKEAYETLKNIAENATSYEDGWCGAEAKKVLPAIEAALAQPAPEPVACNSCKGSGWVVRDPDIGTDQECFVCQGSGVLEDVAQPAQELPYDVPPLPDSLPRRSVGEALREAIAAADALDKVVIDQASDLRRLRIKPQPAQEPVAWIEHHKAGDNLVWDEPNKGTPLYTTPPQRPWVGLTKEDEEAAIEWLGHGVSTQTFHIIDSLLKEKNT